MKVRPPQQRRGEAGGARLNFLILAVVIALGGYSLYNYAPVAYDAYLYKDFMQETVNKAAFPPGQPVSWVESQLRAGAKNYDIPPDALITVQNDSGQIAARVRWARPIHLPGYVYQYKFDHTARSSGFINPQ